MKNVKNKKSAERSKNFRWLSIAALLGVVILIAWLTLLRGDGWQETRTAGILSVRHPADWIVEDDLPNALLRLNEPTTNDTENYYVTIDSGTPLTVKEGANSYITIWVAVLGKDGKVNKLVKTPACTQTGELVNVSGGFFQCDPSSDSRIGVAIDVTDYVDPAKDFEYDVFDGRKYEAGGIECVQGASTKYDLEKTCEKIAKSYTKLKEF